MQRASFDEFSDHEELQRIQAVTEASLAHLGLGELLGELLERVRDILDVDTAAVLLRDPSRDRLVAVAARGLEEEVRQGVQVPMGKGFAGRIAETGEPVMLDQVDHQTVLNPILWSKGIKSLLGVPLLVEGDAIGVLHVGRLQPGRFTAADVELLQLVGDRMALAVRARQMDGDRAAAYTLQQSLLPASLPRIYGLELAARYAPGAGGQVGGDWYDVFETPAGMVVLVMGDVAGRGVNASVVMARARSVLRSYSLREEDPAEILRRLDETMLYFETNELITVFVGVLDPEFRSLSFSSAGHPPPVLATPGLPAELLQAENDPPIGVGALRRRRTHQVDIPPDSTLYLYTDGLVERRGSPLEQGLEKLRQAAAPVTPEQGCVAIMMSLVGGDVIDDDVALLGVRVADLSGVPFRMEFPARSTLLKRVRDSIRRWLSAQDAPGWVIDDLLVAVTEACSNAIRHAYAGGQGNIDISGDIIPGKVQLTVRDTGRWKPHRKSHGGRGLLLMEHFGDHLEISKSTTGTAVRIAKHLH